MTMGTMRGARMNTDFMRLAEIAAQLGSCSRLQVGAAIVKDGRVLTTGWNGVVLGEPRCDHTCVCAPKGGLAPTVDHWPSCPAARPCKTAVHAEARAIGFAAALGLSTDRATLYVTHSPCLSCAQLISTACITDVVYRTEYRSLAGVDLLSRVGVNVVRA